MAFADVGIVGAGLVGAAAALGFARRGYSVLVVERNVPKLQRGTLGIDIRNVALSPASAALLGQLDVWGSVAAAAPYRRMHVWEERGTKAMDFSAAEVGRTELGWIVEQSPLATFLWQRLEDDSGVELMAGASLTNLRAGDREVSFVAGDREIGVKLLVGADGARSTVRQMLGVEDETVDTGHHALATVVRTELPHDNVAYQRFLDRKSVV